MKISSVLEIENVRWFQTNNSKLIIVINNMYVIFRLDCLDNLLNNANKGNIFNVMTAKIAFVTSNSERKRKYKTICIILHGFYISTNQSLFQIQDLRIIIYNKYLRYKIIISTAQKNLLRTLQNIII